MVEVCTSTPSAGWNSATLMSNPPVFPRTAVHGLHGQAMRPADWTMLSFADRHRMMQTAVAFASCSRGGHGSCRRAQETSGCAHVQVCVALLACIHLIRCCSITTGPLGMLQSLWYHQQACTCLLAAASYGARDLSLVSRRVLSG